MGELRVRLHAELTKRLAQVVLDGALSDEQLRRDLSVGRSLRGKARDLLLPRGYFEQEGKARELEARLESECPSMLSFAAISLASLTNSSRASSLSREGLNLPRSGRGAARLRVSKP